jgi:cytochrome c peroxidase
VNNRAAFCDSFSAAAAKLFELGVPPQQWATAEPWLMQSLDEQKESKK